VPACTIYDCRAEGGQQAAKHRANVQNRPKGSARTAKTRLFSPPPKPTPVRTRAGTAKNVRHAGVRLPAHQTAPFGNCCSASTVLGFWPPFPPCRSSRPPKAQILRSPRGRCLLCQFALPWQPIKAVARPCRKGKQQHQCAYRNSYQLRKITVARWLHLQWQKRVAAAGDGSRLRASC
jgi:hypothetical protein